MSDTLQSLWRLQQVMSELSETERRLNNKPEGFAETDRQYNEAKDEIAAQEKRREGIDTNRRALERELETAQEDLVKYEGQLMKVKDQVQYSAAWKEIDAARKKAKEIEDQLLGLMGEIEQIDSDLESRRNALEPLEQQHSAEYEEWQGSLGGLRDEAERIRQQVKDIEKELPDQLRAQFHRIFEHRQGVAVTEIVSNACSACRFRVRPAVSQRLRRGEIVLCEQCRRIFYLEPAAS